MAFKALLEIKGQQFDILSYQNQFFYPNPQDMMFYMKDDIFEEIEDPVRLFGAMHKYHCWQNRLLRGYDRPSTNSPAYRATANLLGGVFTFTIESAGREDIFEHAVSSRKDYQTPLLNGQITFMGREEEDLPIQKIEFWDGFVCEMSEHFSAAKNMTMQITISAASIRVNDSVVIQKDWCITDLQNEIASKQAYSRAATSNIAPVGLANSVTKTGSKSISKSLGKVLEKKAGNLIEKLGETVVKKIEEEGLVEKLLDATVSGIVEKARREKIPRVTKMYWMDEDEKEKINAIPKNKAATLYVQTKDFLPEQTTISIPLKDKEGKIIETLKGNIDSDGWAHLKWSNKK